jgi:hypothetical protein
MELADDQRNPEAHDFPILQSDDKIIALDQMPSSLQFLQEFLATVVLPLRELECARESGLSHVGRQCQPQGRNQKEY